jgi:pimeloyl-ACP methyl ester carboxylesterase
MKRCVRTFILGTLAAFTLTACVFRDVAEQQAKFDALCTLSGTVETAHGTDRPIVVLLVRKDGPGPVTMDNVRLFDHFVLEGGGRWMFHTSPGSYGLAAFEDRNRNLVYQPDEPFLRLADDDLLDCRPGTRIENLALVIPEAGRPRFDGALDVTAVQARSIDDQLQISIGMVTAAGEVAALDDARFSQEMAGSGLWRPFDFLFDARPGVYFLEEYDADKVPVLFVHGANGTPRNFAFLINAIDSGAFQPWVYYYPSGVRLDAIADHLHQTIVKLERRLGFEKLVVVAHSMGGLVSRSFVLKHHDSNGSARIPVFVTIATPWDGHEAARIGVEHAPAVVRSWYDMVPGSPFLTSLFYAGADVSRPRKPLPAPVAHHLLFAFRRNSASFGASDDHVATVASQMRREAQDDADRLYGFDETHMTVLGSDRVSFLINEILAESVP